MIYVAGLGAWGTGFKNLEDLRKCFFDEGEETSALNVPKPQAIPANERRRAPLPAKLAVEVSSQALADSTLAASEVACVFASGLGDTDLTEYMCRELAGETKQISPTKFHNSVHNAPVGYWTISTDCRHPASAIAGLDESVPQGLLEALVQVETEGKPVLFTCYDAATSSVLADLLQNHDNLAAAFVLSPTRLGRGIGIHWEVVSGENFAWPSLHLPPQLMRCYLTNPAAKGLALLRMLTVGDLGSAVLPLSPLTGLRIALESPETE